MDNGVPICLKFGIANVSDVRLRYIGMETIYNIHQLFVYNFNNPVDCRNAEKECKKMLSCGIVNKQYMSNGYTETTYLYNLDKIIKIYERHGGVLIVDKSNDFNNQVWEVKE